MVGLVLVSHSPQIAEGTAELVRQMAGEVEVAAVVVRDDPGLSAGKIEDFCREELASYKKPRRVVFVDALPRNALGKVLEYRLSEGPIEPEV